MSKTDTVETIRRKLTEQLKERDALKTKQELTLYYRRWLYEDAKMLGGSDYVELTDRDAVIGDFMKSGPYIYYEFKETLQWLSGPAAEERGQAGEEEVKKALDAMAAKFGTSVDAMKTVVKEIGEAMMKGEDEGEWGMRMIGTAAS